MKKKLSILMSSILFILCLSGCSSAKDTAMEVDTSYLEQASDFMLDQILPQVTTEQLDQIEKMDDFALQSQFAQINLPATPKSYMEIGRSWVAASQECGEYISHGDYTVNSERNKTVVSAKAQFAHRDATISVTFNSKNLIETITVSADYTQGEILKKAGLNTVLGMGTVFSVLIFISLIISLMKYIPAIQKKFMKKKQNDESETVSTGNVPNPVPAAHVKPKSTDETELFAVISAAIAASQGVNESDFIVRSIKRRPGNRW